MTASSLPYILAHFSPTHAAGTVLESSLMDSMPERPVEDAYGDSYLHSTLFPLTSLPLRLHVLTWYIHISLKVIPISVL